MAIRSNVGDLRGMMMAVQATLHHMTSTDDRLVHHMCPEGENSWFSYNKAKAGNKLDEYKHGFDPIPQAIVQLLKPIYNRLGSRLLLSLCLLGHTQNANESLHSPKCGDSVPNTCFFGPRLVKIGCALAVCTWLSAEVRTSAYSELFACSASSRFRAIEQKCVQGEFFS